MAKKKKPKPADAAAEGRRRARRLRLRPVSEVADRWNAMSGEHLSRSRVWQILQDAEQKLRQRPRVSV